MFPLATQEGVEAVTKQFGEATPMECGSLKGSLASKWFPAYAQPIFKCEFVKRKRLQLQKKTRFK